MIEALVAMYDKGAITADHLVVESLRALDPKSPELVLDSVPDDVLEPMLKYINDFQPGRMKSNYGNEPTSAQIEAAKQWMAATVDK